jgi:competence protein ComEC
MLLCAIAAPLGAICSALDVPPLIDVTRWAVGGSAWLLLRAMIGVGQAAASVPFAALPVVAPGWLALAWYPALGIAWRRSIRREDSTPADEAGMHQLRVSRGPSPVRSAMSVVGRRLRILARPVVGLAAIGVLLAALTVGSLPDGRLHLVVLDIGQGDAILVKAPSGATMLIDGGPDPDLLLRRLGEWLPWWLRRIDIMILTHPHEDHVAGLVAALERYDVGLILDAGRTYENPTYPRFVELARLEGSGRLVAARAGERLRLDATTSVTLLYPSADDVAAPLPAGDINNASVVGLLRNGGFSALLTGDAEAPVEAMLAERGLLSRVDVLKVGHHGSHSSSSPALLDATWPDVALISAGIGNDYGHPHQVTLDHLHAIPGLRLHRTDLEGSLEVITDGLHYRVRSRLVTDPWRSVATAPQTMGRAARTIGAWPYRLPPRPSCCLPPSTFPMASSPIPEGSAASPPRRLGISPQPAWRWIRTSSRSPPCCTTWTSPRRGETGSATGCSVRNGWPNADTRSWRSRSHRIPSPACSTHRERPEAGRRLPSPSRIGMSARSS